MKYKMEDAVSVGYSICFVLFDRYDKRSLIPASVYCLQYWCLTEALPLLELPSLTTPRRLTDNFILSVRSIDNGPFLRGL